MILENVHYTLLQGDCLELMKHIPDKSVDMILCDLPYGTTQCKWDTIIPFELLWDILPHFLISVLYVRPPMRHLLISY